ncbi:hypothetical protein BDZ85DRAFT_44460 [Elsinoe ampelina]|uniref:chitinase n=1 Tax=Elsinoe ampelina TaxID=302913 RepID=A0A6A6G172_9PEZI|nr:hypothetical protein BDZ85DRAFT_44460 [Elsinoe ampelina]
MRHTKFLLGAIAACGLLSPTRGDTDVALDHPVALLGNGPNAQLLDLPIGTCNAQTPCPNGACCSGVTNLCGYSSSECGPGNCTSNCNAKAECGEFGAPGKQKCPLGVCCSKFGFCGSTPDFCDVSAGCQTGFGGCGNVRRPSCPHDSNSVGKRSIGYYESWANTRPCGKITPEDLNLDGFKHLNFAFVFFDPITFQIIPMDKNAASLLGRFTALKEKKPGLQTWVSVGGWSFSDPGPFQKAFSDMSMNAANRKKFIDGLIRFMNTYGFDGLDLDWEYPTANDRGGRPQDSANFVLLSRDIKAAFGKRYGYTITVPASYWYLQHFKLAEHQPHVDWFNLMSYDLHGTWDAASKFVGPFIAPHTNLTEIDLGLDLLWRAGVKPEKVILGQGYYGRSFTLTDPKCNKPDGICRFSGGARPGPCSGASGILNLREILEIIDQHGLKPVHDQKAGVKWTSWDDTQWVSYDDHETLQQKREFANSRCLGGLMVWAIDQVDQKQISPQLPPLSEEEIAEAEFAYQDEAAKGLCYTTRCDELCPPSDFEASKMNGQPGELSTMDRCPRRQYRRLCCTKGSTMGECTWRGYRGEGLSCQGGCAEGEVALTRNTNSRTGIKDHNCAGGLQTYCCRGFRPPITLEQVEDDVKDVAIDKAKSAAEDLAMEAAAKLVCRGLIMAVITPMTLIPGIGLLIRIAAQIAMPALTNVCAKGIAKSGRARINFRGEEHELKIDKPLQPKVDRPPPREITMAPTRTRTCRNALAKRAAEFKTTTKTAAPVFQAPSEIVRTITCNGDDTPQACHHYSSVIKRVPDLGRLTCAERKAMQAPRPIVNVYNSQHHRGWMNHLDPKLSCQRDEWPPADIWQARDKRVWIRLLPGKENGGTGNKFKVCPTSLTTSTLGSHTSLDRGCPRHTVWVTQTLRVTQPIATIVFTNMPNSEDDGLLDNPCLPHAAVDDPGFALLTNDPWYNRNPSYKKFRASYAKSPVSSLARRGISDMPDLDEVYVVGTNTSRRATEEELRQVFDLIECAGPDCKGEMEELGFASLPVSGHGRTKPGAVVATTTSPPSVASTVVTPAAMKGSVESPIITLPPTFDTSKWL